MFRVLRFLCLNFTQVPGFLGATFAVIMAHPRLLWVEVILPPGVQKSDSLALITKVMYLKQNFS